MYYKTKGIVLKAQNFSEADKLVSIYSYDKGKIIAKASGSRKLNSHLRSGIESFSLSYFFIVKGKKIDLISQVQLLNSFPKIRQNLLKLCYALYFLEVIEKFTLPGEKNKNIFHLLLFSLKFLEKENNSFDFLYLFFGLKILSYLGYAPYLENCLYCQKKEFLAYFSYKEGGIVCENCKEKAKFKDKISPQTLKLMQYFLNLKIPLLRGIATLPEPVLSDSEVVARNDSGGLSDRHFSPQIFKEMEIIIDKFLSFQQEKQLKSLRFLKKMRKEEKLF